MHLTANLPVVPSQRVQRPVSETLFQLPELGLRIDRPAGESAFASSVDSRARELHQRPSKVEDRLEQMVRHDRRLLSESLRESPPSIPSQRETAPLGVNTLINHAENLIDRLTDWSAELDQRESKLDQREQAIERRLRSLRQTSHGAIG